MIWSVSILLAACLGVESYAVRESSERLTHGGQLRIYLPMSTEKLEFTPADGHRQAVLYWEKTGRRLHKGKVTGSASDRRWYIEAVTYEDEGTYIQKDFWGREVSTVRVAVSLRNKYVECVAGESLHISLEGIDLADATLSFSGPDANVTLVRDGAPVSQDLTDYWGRVETHFRNIEIRHVNLSDVGRYTLKDRKDRVVSITKMDLIDHREAPELSPLLVLLTLLGIPAGICCCCRKKIFKKKPATSTATLQTFSETVHPPPSGPVGPCPPYTQPGYPGQVYNYSSDPAMGPAMHPPPTAAGPGPGPGMGPPPSPGFNPGYPPQNQGYPPQNPGYPPQNPAYPPQGPAGGFPAQPQQWGHQNQYPPAPNAPVGYAPVMYSGPPSAGAPESKQEEAAPSPAAPLLPAAPQAEAAPAPEGPAFTGSPDGAAYQFQIDKSSTNFL
ncbi:uncharacterized protein ACNS7B_007562 [Menidia menidia]